MIKLENEEEKDSEFDEWLESISMVDEDEVPVVPKLVVDEDEGEDGE